MPKSMGCVYWQYNDTWPGSSWSSVDYFGRWKALQYMAKRFYAPVLVSGAEDVKKGTVDVYVTSDRMDDCKGQLKWTVTDVSGKKLDEGALDVDVPARKSQMVRSLPLQEQIAKNGKNNVLVWLKLDVDGRTVSDNMVSFVYPRELKLVDPKLSAQRVRFARRIGDVARVCRDAHGRASGPLDMAGTRRRGRSVLAELRACDAPIAGRDQGHRIEAIDSTGLPGILASQEPLRHVRPLIAFALLPAEKVSNMNLCRGSASFA